MASSKLDLVFDPRLIPSEEEGRRIIHCCYEYAGVTGGSESLREFHRGLYEDRGRAVVLWWLRRFSTRNASGNCLHDLFEWDGTSALWFTQSLLTHNDYGVFPLHQVAIRTLELWRAGEISEVRIVGAAPDLAEVFRQNGLERVSVLEKPTSTANPVQRGVNLIRGFYRRYVQNRFMRWRYRANHAPSPREILFYSAVPNEWEIPGSGNHRYLQDALEEILGMGGADGVQPLVSGIPSARKDDSEWSEFLDYSLREKRGVYAMGYATLSDLRAIRSRLRFVRSEVDRWLAAPPSEFFEWNGWDLSGVTRPILERLVWEVERSLVLYEAMKRAFETGKPKALLLRDEVYPTGRIYLAAAKAAGVRTVSVQHGNIYPSHWIYFMDAEAKGLSRPPLPDVFAVYGSATVRLLTEKNGFPKEPFRVVGARRFRGLDEQPPTEEFAKVREEGRPLILVAGQLHQDMARLYDWLFHIASKEKEAVFVFKPHPRDKAGDRTVRERCRSLPNTIHFDGPLGDALPACTVVVSSFSTVLLESVWLGIGGISVMMSGETPADWQTESGLVRIARRKGDLEEAIEKATEGSLFSDEDRRKSEVFLEDYLGKSLCADGKVIGELLDDDPSPNPSP